MCTLKYFHPRNPKINIRKPKNEWNISNSVHKPKFENFKNGCYDVFPEPEKYLLRSNTGKTTMIFRISILKTYEKHEDIQLHLYPSYLKVIRIKAIFSYYSQFSAIFNIDYLRKSK